MSAPNKPDAANPAVTDLAKLSQNGSRRRSPSARSLVLLPPNWMALASHVRAWAGRPRRASPSIPPCSQYFSDLFSQHALNGSPQGSPPGFQGTWPACRRPALRDAPF